MPFTSPIVKRNKLPAVETAVVVVAVADVAVATPKHK